MFFLLFILAKRQIIRFAWKATRPPHASIGLDAPKVKHVFKLTSLTVLSVIFQLCYVDQCQTRINGD